MNLRSVCLAVPVLLLAGCSSEPSDTFTGDVLSVVSAETMKLSVDDEERTVRVAGVRVPGEGECLHDEAEAALAELTDEDELDVTVLGEDTTGTQLVEVALGQGDDLATAMVAAGLAVADAEEDELTSGMRAARQRAMDAEVGWFSPQRECTFAGIRATAQQALTDAIATQQPSTSAAAASAVSGLAAAIAAAEAAEAFTHEAQRDLRLLAYPLSRVTELSADLAARKVAAQTARTAMEARRVSLVEAEKKAAARAKAEAKAEKARKKAAKAARARAKKAAAQARAAREAAAARARARTSTSRGSSSSSGGGGYAGYTGPRCYAPGGKTWRPC